MEEHKAIEVYREELNQMKTQVAVIVVEQTNIKVEQNNLRANQDKIVSVLDSLNNRQSTSELTDVAIKERTDQHSKTIEHLQSNEVDMSKILNKHENDLTELRAGQSVIKWIGAAIGTGLIGFLLSHFIK